VNDQYDNSNYSLQTDGENHMWNYFSSRFLKSSFCKTSIDRKMMNVIGTASLLSILMHKVGYEVTSLCSLWLKSTRSPLLIDI
jgi:hypothetical protein